DLVAIGKREQLAEPGADVGDELPDRLLAVRGPHQCRARAREVRELRGANPGGARAEPPIHRLQLVGNLQQGLGHAASSKLAGSTCPGARLSQIAAAPRWWVHLFAPVTAARVKSTRPPVTVGLSPPLLLELGVDPIHLRAELLADHLDLVLGLLLAHA